MKRLFFVSMMTLATGATALQPAFAQNTQAQAIANRDAISQTNALAARILLQLEAAHVDGILRAEQMADNTLGGSVNSGLVLGAAVSSTAGSFLTTSALHDLHLIMTMVNPQTSLTATQSRVASAGGSLLMLSGILVVSNSEEVANLSYAKARDLIGLSSEAQALIDQAVNETAKLLGLSPAQKQRLADGTKDALLKVVGKNEVALDIGQVVLDLKLLDTAADIAFRNLRSTLNQKESQAESDLKLQLSDRETMISRLELLKALDAEMVNVVRKDQKLLSQFAPLSARTKAAIQFLESQLK